MNLSLSFFLGVLFFFFACENVAEREEKQEVFQQGVLSDEPLPVVLGAAQFEAYLPKLRDKKVGVVVNQTSTVGFTHLVDTLLGQGVNIVKIFAPEHGFRGTADAGEKVQNGKDVQTGLPILSLYGKTRKPTPEMLQDLDVVVFDIQDVGARFYTYISTMHYVMEACAAFKIPVLVLDRPNPHGHYIDGPIREEKFQSFVGMHPIPIVHGMTVGELAQMINGEGWLNRGIQCDLTVIPCLNYTHQTRYVLPIKPSPNLPNMRAIYLYPSLCLFEGTVASVGRGTPTPFQVYGHPLFPNDTYEFTPEPTEGAKKPLYMGEVCKGVDLNYLTEAELAAIKQLNLSYLLDFYQKFPYPKIVFNSFFEKLAGTKELQSQIEAGKTEAEIRASWQTGLAAFQNQRKPYLLYAE